MLDLAATGLGHLYFAAASCSHNFFFFIDWWKYLPNQPTPPDCAINMNFPGDIWLVGLAILDMLLRLAGFLAVVSIIIAGAQLIFSEGSPDKATAARNRLFNSLIGLAIAFTATAAVVLVGNTVGGGTTASGLPNPARNQTTLNNIFDVVFIILGALAFLFTVIAGFRFVMSRGDPSKIADARRQILYGALGLVLIGAASAIVNFVLDKA